MVILLHSSKTMRAPLAGAQTLTKPRLLDKAILLDTFLKTLSPIQLARIMHISEALSVKTHQLIADWNYEPKRQVAAVDSFLGDIYSGLQVTTWTVADRDYANQTLLILSGLYGALRPLDAIYPYRLEMGYNLRSRAYKDLYTFWGSSIAQCLPKTGAIINLSSVEYSKTILPFVDATRLVTPTFLTVDQKTAKPTFFAVHAKIARGAFAHWLITQRIEADGDLSGFHEIGYHFNSHLSTPSAPVYVCDEFGGKGLSIRLK